MQLVLTKKVRNARFPNRFIGIKLNINYSIDEDHQRDWSNGKLLGLKLLLVEIERKYGDINKPIINLNKDGQRAEFSENTVNINLPKWIGFISDIDKLSEKYLIERYHREFKKECRNQGIQLYLEGKEPNQIIEYIEKSSFELIELLLSDFDNLQPSEKTQLQKELEHSKIGTNLLAKYDKLDKRSPKIQVKSLIKKIDSIGAEDAKELFNAILESKHATKLIEKVSKLPKNTQVMLLKNVDRAAELLTFRDRLDTSLRKFKKLLKAHSKKATKDEKSIHALLAKDYWLLGAEYYGTTIKSDIDSKGKKTSETYIKPWKLYPDFLIEKVDQTTDSCVVIELEEANDKIFNADKTLSKQALDGLFQAISYHIYFNVEKNKSAKGIAILGLTGKLDQNQKDKLAKLNNLFPKVEIKTYDQLIEDAEKLIKFIDNYSKEK